MAFKMKYSSGTPFHFHGGDPAEHTSSAGGIDPKKLDYKTTETATNLAGEHIDTAGTATVTIPGTRQQTDFSTNQAERDKQKQWIKDNPEQYAEMIAQTKPKEVTVTRERDYSQEVEPKKEKLYANPFTGTGFNYKRYGGTQESGGYNYRLKQAKTAGDSLTLNQIKELGKNVYGGGFYKMPGMATWMKKNKLTYGKKRKPTTTPGSQSESISDYKYTINE